MSVVQFVLFLYGVHQGAAFFPSLYRNIMVGELTSAYIGSSLFVVMPLTAFMAPFGEKNFFINSHC